MAKMQTKQEELLTVPELAKALKVPVSWIYSRTRTNSIRFIKCGKYRRFRLSEVLEDLENQQGVA